MLEMAPPFVVEPQVKMVRYAFAAKSAEPPMPFIIFVPQILVLLTWP